MQATRNVLKTRPHALAPVANECLQKTHTLLSRKAPCQLEEEVYGDEPVEDEEDDHDTFMTSVCDLCGSFARVMGSHFIQYLPQFLPPLCSFAKSSRPPSDRSMAMGCLGELAQELEGEIFDHWQTVFLPAVLAGLADEDDNVKRNAAFTAGVCCEGLRDRATGQYAQLLSAVSPLFQVDATLGDYSAACVDNAAAAVARMVMTSPANVPISQVFPIFLKALPLKNDMSENETVYKCLIGLVQMNHPEVLAYKAEILLVIQESISDGSKVDNEMKAKLAAVLPSLG